MMNGIEQTLRCILCVCESVDYLWMDSHEIAIVGIFMGDITIRLIREQFTKCSLVSIEPTAVLSATRK